jgi:hypothetical protein
MRSCQYFIAGIIRHLSTDPINFQVIREAGGINKLLVSLQEHYVGCQKTFIQILLTLLNLIVDPLNQAVIMETKDGPRLLSSLLTFGNPIDELVKHLFRELAKNALYGKVLSEFSLANI